MVYSKAAVYTCKPLVYTCKPLLYKKNLKERCYLHSVQQSYGKNSCKPGIKYFTSVNHQFTTCKVAVYSKAVVYNYKLLKLNFRCVLLITLLDTVEVKPRAKAHFEAACKSVVYSKAVVYNL